MNAKIDISLPDDIDQLRLRVRCPESLKQPVVDSIHRILRDAVERIGKVVSRQGGVVTWTYQAYESSVFWYIVLNRPMMFTSPLLRNGACVRELLNPTGAAALRTTTQGIVVDLEKNWLILHWKEALAGILGGIRDIPMWKQVLMKMLRCSEASVQNMSDEVHERIMRHIAGSTAFLVPLWVLHRNGYFRDQLFWLPREDMKNTMVYDLAGVSIPEYDVCSGNVRSLDNTATPIEELRTYPTANCGHAHFYTTAKHEYRDAVRDYRHIQRRMKAKEPSERERVRLLMDKKRLRAAFGKKLAEEMTSRDGKEISRSIQAMAKAMGYVRKGRWHRFLGREESLEILRLCCKNLLLLHSSHAVEDIENAEDKERLDEKLDAVMGKDTLLGRVINTKYVGWSGERADKLRFYARNLESLVNMWNLPFAYNAWTLLKNVGDSHESMLAWCYETLDTLLAHRRGGRRGVGIRQEESCGEGQGNEGCCQD